MKSEAITDIGSKRKMNQDSIYNSDEKVGVLPNLYIVADGMGGHKAGDHASKMCVDVMIETIKNHGDVFTPISVLEEAIISANKSIYAESKSNEEYEGMGTTVVSATLDEDMLYVANVGDSRLYYIYNNELIQLTSDHSLVEEMVRRGEISQADARIHPNKNIITRALGTDQDVTVDFFELEADKVDRVLLCSDGLTNMVDEQEMLDIILRSNDLKGAVKTLVDKANKYGGKDNISVILIEM